jgi:hypothetical protein
MDEIERRVFIKGATVGAVVFMVDGVETPLTPKQARAQGVALRVLKAEEVRTLEAIGETLAIGARQHGVAHFVDSQLAVPPEQALLTIRVSETRPPYVNFYRAALTAIDSASLVRSKRPYAELTEPEQRDFVNALRQNKIEVWHGPPQAGVYLTLRNDSIDVVYGTVEGFARLGVPYMPHILPQRSW